MIVSSPFPGQRTIPADLSSSRSGNTGRRGAPPPHEDLAGAEHGSGPRARELGGARWFRAGMRARACLASLARSGATCFLCQ